MKNQNKVRKYTGNYFKFETDILMYRFIELYKDLFIDYKFIEFDNGSVTLKVICGKGVIPEIKKGLKKEIICKGHNRYYVKAA